MARLQVRSRSGSSMRPLDLAYARSQQPQHCFQALMQYPETRHRCSHPSFDVGSQTTPRVAFAICIAQAAFRRANIIFVYSLVSLFSHISWSFSTLSIQRMAQALTKRFPSFEYTSSRMTILSLEYLRPKVLYPQSRRALHDSSANNECNVAWEGICNFEILYISTLLLPAYHLESFDMNFYYHLQHPLLKAASPTFT